MMTPGNLWFEVRFEIGMLGRGSDIGGREYWGARSQATKAVPPQGDSGRLLMKCLVMSGLVFHPWSHFTNSIVYH